MRGHRRDTVGARGAVVAAAALVVAAALGTGAGTASAAAPVAGPIACVVGDLCIEPVTGGAPVLVPGGQSASFDDLVMSSITNLTGEAYCVSSGGSFTLPNGATYSVTEQIFGVTPTQAGQFCPF